MKSTTFSRAAVSYTSDTTMSARPLCTAGIRPSKSAVAHLYFKPRWSMTALTMSGSNPTIVFGSSAALELNGGKSAEVIATYVLPLLAAAAVVLLLAAAAGAELELALEL